MQSMHKACFKLAVAQFAFGANVAVSKKLNEFWPAGSIVGMRFLLASILLFVCLRISKQSFLACGSKVRTHLTLKDWANITGQALLGGLLFNAFFQAGLAHVTACCAGILTSAFPMIMAISAFLLLGEKINRSAFVGILLTMCGIITIHLGMDGEFSSGDISIIGTLLILCALIPEALASILVKKQNSKLTSLGVATLVNGIGALSTSPVLISESFQGLLSMQWQAWSLIFIASLCTLIFYSCWISGLESIEASTAGIFVGIMPLSSAFFGAIIIGELPHMNEFLAGLFILASIVAASRGASHRTIDSSDKPILAAA